jgi:hypothetical protein
MDAKQCGYVQESDQGSKHVYQQHGSESKGARQYQYLNQILEEQSSPSELQISVQRLAE